MWAYLGAPRSTWKYLKVPWEYQRVAEILPCDPRRYTGKKEDVHMDGGSIPAHNPKLVVETLHKFNVNFSRTATFRFYQICELPVSPQRNARSGRRSHLRNVNFVLKRVEISISIGLIDYNEISLCVISGLC